MRFQDITSIWTQDLTALSNADRGKVYYERAKQIVSEALADSRKRVKAVDGQRFRRDYLIEAIGCAASAVSQNPNIRSLLTQTDRQLSAACEPSQASILTTAAAEISSLRQARRLVSALQHRVRLLEDEIAQLKGKGEAG